MRRRTWHCAWCFVSLLIVGCSEPGPTRYRLSGKANFDGKPIPFGDVLFTPDGSKQNSGAQGIATIRNGKYDTAAEGKGVGGGPTVVRVTGLSAQAGKVLCEYEYQVDLPKQDSTHDVEAPASSASNRAASPEI